MGDIQTDSTFSSREATVPNPPSLETGSLEQEGNSLEDSNTKGLSSLEKAAIFVILLGKEVAVELFKYLEQRELEKLIYVISQIENITLEQRKQVINEFYELLSQDVLEGGMGFTRSVLKQAFGEQSSNKLLSDAISSQGGYRPFTYLTDLDMSSIASFIQEEHPQTIALVLVSLIPEQSSAILGQLRQDTQIEVARRIALMDRTNPEFLQKVDRVLEERLSQASIDSYKALGGIENIVSILNISDRKTERTILDTLEKSDPELAENIKKRMFTFEDIVLLDDRSVQRVIREVSPQEFAKALKGVEQAAVKEKIFKNTSKRIREILQDEIKFLGPTRRREVEEVQLKIVMIMRRLEEQGEIIIARGGQDETFI